MNKMNYHAHSQQYETIIGLEVHIQLATNSKLFSGAAATYSNKPNSQISIIDLALPGTLPTLNEKAVDFAIKFGLSINANIATRSVFARKNYFYPDLPKGYQITQFELPIISNGFLPIKLENDKNKKIKIARAHLEEDSGKMLHDNFPDQSGIDFNRAGISLIEVVSEPELHSAKEAITYLKTLHSLIRYLDISDGNMQEGSFRCDANVSVRPLNHKEFGTRTEIKNLNSFRFIEKAIDYEITRQIAIIENGGKIIQETRLFDSVKNETRSLRVKEESLDYRYLPDPDLLPLVIDPDHLDRIRKTLPELPWEKHKRFCHEFGLNNYDAEILSSTKELAIYFENTLKATKASAKLVANWIIGELLRILNKKNITILQSPINAAQLAELIDKIYDNSISGKIAKEVFVAICEGEGNATDIIKSKGLEQITNNSEIEKIIDEIIIANPNQVAKYRSGKIALFTFFVGLVMKATKGKANPKIVNELLTLKLT